MRLDDDGDQSNVEDRRGASGGGGGGLRLGIGGTLVVLALSLVFRQNLFALLGATPGAGPAGPSAPPAAVEQRKAAEAGLERTAVASFNDAQRVFGGAVQQYRSARLVLFWDGTRSACGGAESAMGPFYCPGDERVYIDLGFYRELASRYGAPGQFAQAYVIAHELGHHLQHLLGIEDRMRAAQERNPQQRNALSVRLELQADCFAGVWGKSAEARGLLDPGDLESGLGAAAAVGDDRLQRAATGRAHPESFTHGTSAQRTRWFRRGFDEGTLQACDTFKARAL
jgi:predicted metalloprotease